VSSDSWAPSIGFSSLFVSFISAIPWCGLSQCLNLSGKGDKGAPSWVRTSRTGAGRQTRVG